MEGEIGFSKMGLDSMDSSKMENYMELLHIIILMENSLLENGVIMS